MAKRVEQITLGIDTAKDELVVYHFELGQRFTVTNTAAEIRAWLRTLTGSVRLAIEPTNTYHLALIDQAHALGHTVYLINARQIAHYRRAIDQRHKSDPHDAALLARFLVHEAPALRPYQPLHPKARQLWALIKRRATVVKAHKQLRQSLAETKIPVQALFNQFDQLLKRIERRISELLQLLGWTAAFRHCLSIPGIGPVNAAALVAAFHRGAFANAHAFVAFLGLDVRLKDSGKFQGQRKLTKCGEPELRRLLYCAAQASRRHPRFQLYYQQQLDKGRSKIAANVALARKLARIAFSLIQNQQSFKITTAEA